MTTLVEIQRHLGVAADGKLGPKTLAAIGEALGMAPPLDTPFERALSVILKHEGGFVNHPKDPGGITNLGVTKKTWEAWTKRTASVADMKALTPDAVAPLYRKNYWLAAGCDFLPEPLALCVFDFAVNAGPARAVRYLQRLVGAKDDGIPGSKTMIAVEAFIKAQGLAEAVKQYQDKRIGYYQSLPTFDTFGKGWLRRVKEVQQTALDMI